MRQSRAAMFVAVATAGLGVSGAAADEVVILDDASAQGLLWRTDAQRTPPYYAMAVSGLEADEKILAIDTLPGIGNLYGLTTKRLYAINQVDGKATPVGPRFALSIAQPGLSTQLDFDPVSRVAWIFAPQSLGASSSAMPRARIDPESGAVLGLGGPMPDDVPLFAYVPGDPAFGDAPSITAFACLGDVNGPRSFTAYGIDGARGTLIRFGTEGGLQSASDDRDAVTTIGPITGTVDGVPPIALEFAWTDGTGYAVGRDRNGMYVYRIDPTTAAATLQQQFSLGLPRDFAVLPSMLPLATLDLDVRKAVARYDFRGGRARDSMTIAGRLPYPQGGLSGKRVRVDMDGVVREFTTDARGRAVSGPDSFRFVGKLSGGTIGYALVVRKTRLDEVAGVDRSTPTGPTTMTADLFLDGRAYRTNLALDYFARRGRGLARTP